MKRFLQLAFCLLVAGVATWLTIALLVPADAPVAIRLALVPTFGASWTLLTTRLTGLVVARRERERRERLRFIARVRL